MKGTRRGASAAVAAATALLVLGGPAGIAVAAKPAVSNPTVSGPIHGGVRGYPWNKSLFPLRGKGYDYSENEYFFKGTATDLSTGASAPYESRMLVRLPRKAHKFSGTLLVEWLNVTGQSDLETAWPVEARYLMRHGIGYVGVSAQLAGVCCGPTTLKGWDPARYAPLVHPGDQLSYDIFSQAIRALRGPKHIGANPMRGLHTRNVVVTGASQSAFYLTDFVNDGYNRHQIDLYVITRGGGPFKTFSTPIFQLNEEDNEIPQKDNARFVGWQEAGAAHAPEQWWGYIAREQQRDGTAPPGVDPIGTACSVNHGSVDYSSRALSTWTTRYLRTGKMPPRAPRVKTDSSGNIVRDSNGLARGGLRHVFIQVPVGYNSSTGCPLFGTYTPWSAAKIRSLYATHGAYVHRVSEWSEDEVDRGWLLPADRGDALRKARAFRAPWNGKCTSRCPAPLGL
jgi:alpha/beta hydrolase family protein